MKIRPQAVVVPELRKRPCLRERQDFATRLTCARTPGVHVVFRPEEQDARSGVNEVVIPLLEGQREVHHLVVTVHLIPGDIECDAGVRLIGIMGLDIGIRM